MLRLQQFVAELFDHVFLLQAVMPQAAYVLRIVHRDFDVMLNLVEQRVFFAVLRAGPQGG
ncbi:hypothetical protein D3C79_1016430 [compost metagenome]